MDGPGLMKLSWTGGPVTLDPIYGLWTYSMEFSVIKENSSALEFCKNTPNFFELMFLSLKIYI
jgi:hypothetical protein